MSSFRKPFDRNRPTGQTGARPPVSNTPLPEARFQSLLGDMSRFFAQAEQELQQEEAEKNNIRAHDQALQAQQEAQRQAQADAAVAAAQSAAYQAQRQAVIEEILQTMAKHQLTWQDLVDN